jgi:2-polyprenyl-3-methyl-5-hydroxy-6-metoxy-1,4-benzoquinol methylase
MQAAYASVATGAARRGDEFWDDAEARCREILFLCDGSRERFVAAVSKWVEFSYEFLLKQGKFLKSGHYAIADFDSIRRDLYDDEEKMKDFYLIALMFSYLFSPNYVAFFAFFRRHALPVAASARSVADVGCGHGVYLANMLLASADSRGIGFDISPGSLATTSRLLDSHKIDRSRYELSLGDIQAGLEVSGGTQDLVTCFEVIEHLERPGDALVELRRLLGPGGTLCLSTAIRMESVDHIHLFRTPEEVRDLIAGAGLRIVEDEVIPLSNEDIEQPGVLERLIADPRVALGYVAIAN